MDLTSQVRNHEMTLRHTRPMVVSAIMGATAQNATFQLATKMPRMKRSGKGDPAPESGNGGTDGDVAKMMQPHLKAQDKTETAHTRALQYLSNGSLEVPYSETLRMVTVEGDKQPLMPARVTQKHPGYTRNQLGAPFTS